MGSRKYMYAESVNVPLFELVSMQEDSINFVILKHSDSIT